MERTVDGQAGQGDGEPVAVHWCDVESVPLAGFDALQRPTLAWADGSTTVVAGGEATTLEAAGPERFQEIRRGARRLFARLETPGSVPTPARPRLFGGFSFTDTHRESDEAATWDGFPDAWFLLPAVQYVTTDAGSWLTTAAVGPNAHETARNRLAAHRDPSVGEPVPQDRPGVTSRQYAPPRSDWQREIREATDAIEAGTLRKVVLAQTLTAELSEPIRPSGILSRLGESYPDCYRFGFEPVGGGVFFGATPERLVSVDGRTVETEGLAGSIGRGETTEEDEWLATQLQESEKNRHEHDIVVETIREQLAPFTESVRTGERSIRKLANVQHLQTPVRARLTQRRHVLDLVEALHPTPAVGGLPPAQALQTIRETEVFDRGWYAAPVGWFDAEGNGEFAVAIRSAIARDQTATLFAGAGIVADSDPDEEYDELQLKYRPILDELA